MANLARPSRDGDQFHYLWAARRCLLLLPPTTDLTAISIEDASPSERPPGPEALTGDSVIDVAEYYGDKDPRRAARVRYVQLKHSTRRVAKAWTASGLKTTLKGFAVRYEALTREFGAGGLTERFEFRFVTNRPISSAVEQAVRDAANATTACHQNELTKLAEITGLAGDDLSSFCRLVYFKGRQDDYWEQRNMLFQEVNGYLPDADFDAPVQLKELVTRKALSESENDPLITKIDVLRALRTDESRLYPAPCQIDFIRDAIPREQGAEIIQAIVQAEGRPVVVHALAGVGKSVFSTSIQNGLPRGSVMILYDCFGKGGYRSATGSRHRHREALVQIANELAGKGLCRPLIPTSRAAAKDYVRAFVYRLQRSVESIHGTEPGAVLCIVVDAADNAQQAAQENGEPRSFVRDLLRETLPDGVRLVVLCRSHRQYLLDPPPCALRLELAAFAVTETAGHLRQTFPDASNHDVDEFHRLSSQNPRVQALVLSQAVDRHRSLPETLRRLGPHPTTVDDAIETLLNEAVATTLASVGPVEREGLDRICVGLATLRPLVPISVLSEMSGVPPSAVRSFVLDLGWPLLLDEDTVQFRDEPVETWFREKFRPARDEMAAFIGRLQPLSTTSAYVASVLPQLMLETGRFADLVELTLASAALPETSLLEKRDVELQRVQFAVKAALRSKRHLDAAKLALKAGGLTAGDSRQRNLIQSNTDLAALFLDHDLIQEMVARTTFGSNWRGSHHAYEAGLMSGRQALVADARSRLRMAYDWLDNWSRLAPEARKQEEVSEDDIAELAMAQLKIHGAGDAARDICRWRPRAIAFRVGRLVARRLIDHGRLADVDALALAGSDVCLVLAVILELRDVHRTPAVETVQRAFRLVSRARPASDTQREPRSEDAVLDAVAALTEAALKLSLCSRAEAAALLAGRLPATPPRHFADRFSGPSSSLLRAYCLRAALEGKVLQLADLAHTDLKAEIEKQSSSHHSSQEATEFTKDVGALLPWYELWAEAVLGKVTKDELRRRVAGLREKSAWGAAFHYPDGRHVSGEIARIWFEVLHLMNALDAETVGVLTSWIESLQRPLFTPTLTALARLGAQREETNAIALQFAAQAFHLTRDDRADAESKLDGYVDVARAVLAVSETEAKAYFDEAVAVASKVGDENVPRWEAMLDLAVRASQPNRTVPEVAYRFARSAELTWHHVADDKYFDWDTTVAALASLCPRSSLAILSRWRDRRFGWTGKVLPTATHALIERGAVDPLDALPLVGFEGRWNHSTSLEAVLTRCGTRAERNVASTLLYRYMKFSCRGTSTGKDFRDVLMRHRLSLPDDLDARIAFVEQRERHAGQHSPEPLDTPVGGDGAATPEWDEIFSGNDLTTVDGVARSRVAFKSTSPPWKHEDFFAEAIRRIPAGAEPQFVRAVADTPDCSGYCLRDLLGQIPDDWRRRPAVVRSLADAVKTVCRRDCMEIAKHRYWKMPPFDGTCARAGVSEADVIDTVLNAIGESADPADTNRLFSLVGLLASKLGCDEALDALEFGLDLFEAVLEERDGDGPWSAKLAPPATVQESIAGYVYAGLGAPTASVRWEAAHAVVGLCALDRVDVLRRLVAFAEENACIGPFTDAGLPFYRLHAFQWLMIAFARAATEHPGALAPLATCFVDWALGDQPHVMIRQFAARTALALLRAGRLPADDRLEERLRHVNVWALPVVESKFDELVSSDEPSTAKDDKNHFYFYLDVGPYWYKPLGRVFGLSRHRIETEALKVIRDELHTSGSTSWRDDERKHRGMYRHERTYASHGSYPDTDDYQLYLSYHAMMIVAGRLLATVSVHRDMESGNRDEFADWLSRHDLTRRDGRWFADRRDPVPLERPAWLGRREGDPGYGAVTPADFNEALHDARRLNVWGSWSIGDSDYVQSVHVQSAFVCPEKSAALLRALSTADNVYHYVVPSADDEQQIDRAGFVLQGWLVDRGSRGEIDGKDKWSGDVPYPAPGPAPKIAELMAIETDLDGRVWRDAEKAPVMFSQVWGQVSVRDEDDNPEHGYRLQASLDFVTKMLRRCGRDLIIEVRIDRRRRRSRWRSDPREHDDEQTPTRARVYLLAGDGRLASL